MSGIATAIIGGAVIGGIATSEAGKEAAGAQTEASQASISEQQRQFDATVELLKPYVEAGTGSLAAQQALLGLNGEEAQQQAIAGLETSPEFQALQQQGEEAILQNAAATGGLRGGNTQSALAQFRPQLLNQLIQQRFQNLGGITSLGQASAAGQANLGQASANSISNLLGDIGSAQAGQALATGQAISNVGSSLGNALILSKMF